MYSQHSAALTAPEFPGHVAVTPDSSTWPFLVTQKPEPIESLSDSLPNIIIDANIPAGIPEDNPYVSHQPPKQHSNLVIDATLAALVVSAIVVGAAAMAKEFVVNGAVMGIASIAPFIQ